MNRYGRILLTGLMGMTLSGGAFADVTGRVKFDGKPPEPVENPIAGIPECASQHPDGLMDDTVVCNSKGELANVVISIKADDPKSLGGAVPAEPAVLDQKGCMYVPHVLPMMLGQQLKVGNSDVLTHNSHSMSELNDPFEMTQVAKDPGKAVDHQPNKAETIKVKCDIHPWMIAYIIVLPHPYFAVSKTDGTFAIKGLKDGEYTLQAWHERYGVQTTKITVKDGKAEANFTFKELAASEDQGKVKLASAKVETSDSCPACDEAAGPTTKPTDLIHLAEAPKSN